MQAPNGRVSLIRKSDDRHSKINDENEKRSHPGLKRSNNATTTQIMTSRRAFEALGFKIDILGVDTWRWTILPRTLRDLLAMAHCKAEIDAMLARESKESKSDQSRPIPLSLVKDSLGISASLEFSQRRG